MTERKTLSDSPVRGALAEGAERFDRIARSLKSPQVVNHPAPPASDAPHMTAVSPDEIWARNYMTYAIGTKPEPGTFGGFAPVAHLVSMPKFTAPSEQIVARTAEIVAKPAATEIVRSAPPQGPIGSRIGKPVRRRSWLGRLLHGGA